MVRKNKDSNLAQQVTVIFKEPCGPEKKISLAVVGLDRVNDNYYVSPLTTTLPEAPLVSVKAPVNFPKGSGQQPSPERSTTALNPKEVVSIKDLKIQPILSVESEKMAGEGWKLVSIYFAMENTTRDWIKFPHLSGTLKTSEGFKYELEDFWDITAKLDPKWAKEVEASLNRVKTNRGKVLIPPGFKIFGFSQIVKDIQEVWGLIMSARVGKTTSGFAVDIPGHKEIAIKKVIPDAERKSQYEKAFADMGFPTSRPDTDFKNFGDPIPVPEQGKARLLFKRRIPEVEMVEMGIVLQNESNGYPQKFLIECIGTFADNGWLYLQSPVYPPINENLGPGITKERGLICPIDQKVKKGKLWLNINGQPYLFNLDLEKSAKQ